MAESEQEAVQKFWDRFRHNLQVTSDNQESVASYAQHLSQLPDRLGEARRLYEQLLQLSPNLQYLKQLVELFAGRMNDDKSAYPYFEQLRSITRQRKLFDDPMTQAAYERYLDNRPLLDRLFS